MAESGISGAFALDEITGWSLVQLAGWPDNLAALEAAVAARCGVAAPAEVGETAGSDGITAIRVAPDRFWLIDDSRGRGGAADEAEGVCVTLLGEGRRRFRLSGSEVPAVLASCAALDWRSPGFAPGRAAQTVIHRVPVLLHRRASLGVDVYLPRSYAESLIDWISGAAAEFGAQ